MPTTATCTMAARQHDRQSANQTTSQSDNRSIRQSGNQSVSQSDNRSISQSVSRSVRQSDNRSIRQSVSQTIEQSDSRSVRLSTPSGGASESNKIEALDRSTQTIEGHESRLLSHPQRDMPSHTSGKPAPMEFSDEVAAAWTGCCDKFAAAHAAHGTNIRANVRATHAGVSIELAAAHKGCSIKLAAVHAGTSHPIARRGPLTDSALTAD
jgi:hypothetical protein